MSFTFCWLSERCAGDESCEGIVSFRGQCQNIIIQTVITTSLARHRPQQRKEQHLVLFIRLK